MIFEAHIKRMQIQFKGNTYKMGLWNFRGKQNTVTEALQLALPEHAIISVAGAGGKTSLIFAWAKELASEGRRVAVTTTTHMSRQEHEVFTEGGIVMEVSPDPDRPEKVKAPSEEAMELLYESFDAVLIEADGSRRMPLKWPAPHEPVIPDRTDITVYVCGLSALGRPLSEVMYRAEHLPEAMNREAADEALVAAVAASPDGGLKGARGEFRVFMNQADTSDRAASAEYIQKLLAVRGIQSAWGSLRDRALCGACPYQAQA